MAASSNVKRLLIAFVPCCALALTPAAAGARDTAKNDTHHGINVISGGVGENSEAQMDAMRKDFNLQLLFAAKDGHFLAGVPVTITDARGNEVVARVADGPYLFVSLPPGKYRIRAEYDGKSVTRSTTIPDGGRREQVFRFEDPAMSS